MCMPRVHGHMSAVNAISRVNGLREESARASRTKTWDRVIPGPAWSVQGRMISLSGEGRGRGGGGCGGRGTSGGLPKRAKAATGRTECRGNRWARGQNQQTSGYRSFKSSFSCFFEFVNRFRSTTASSRALSARAAPCCGANPLGQHTACRARCTSFWTRRPHSEGGPHDG